MTKYPPHRTRVKICGLTSPADAYAAVNAGADAVGLVFVPSSPRHIDMQRASEIAHAVGPFVTMVGVFQNSDPADALFTQWLGDWVQLHGDEDASLVSEIRRCVIKGFAFDADRVRAWDRCAGVDALLVDGSAGGEGTAFDHRRLAELMPEVQKPVIVAGGLTPDNVGEVIRTIRPYGVDVSSGVEQARGKKDPARIRAFCQAVRQADHESAR